MLPCDDGLTTCPACTPAFSQKRAGIDPWNKGVKMMDGQMNKCKYEWHVIVHELTECDNFSRWEKWKEKLNQIKMRSKTVRQFLS